MCGCSSGGYGFSSSNSNLCRGQLSRLEDSRNKLAILYNITKDSTLKSKYKIDRSEIEQLIMDAKNDSCPDNETVLLIVAEVNNEYTKYYNN